MSSLYDFEDVEPPAVREVRPLTVDGYIIGFMGPSNRTRAIVCQQTRFMQSDGTQNYFRQVGGYSFQPSMLDAMEEFDVTRIIIEEIDNDRVFEFDVTQYRKGVETCEYEGEPKLCVPVRKALHSWKRGDCTFLNKNGTKRGVKR